MIERSRPDRQPPTMAHLGAAMLLCLAIAAGCRSRADRAPSGGARSGDPAPTGGPAAAADGRASDETIWERLGEWSGRTSMQTQSFTGTTGALRIVWATTHPTAPDGGSFRVTIHSAISGRPLDVAVDQKGPGHDTAYVTEDPRVFFAVVEASNLQWAFTVDEAIGTRRVTPP